MESSALIKALLGQRESWCELGDGLAVKLRRPAESEMPAFYRGVSVESLKTYTVDWRGFTEATLLGQAVGASDALPFDADVWAALMPDRIDWVEACSAHLVDQITKHVEAHDRFAKNSPPSSTKRTASSARARAKQPLPPTTT